MRRKRRGKRAYIEEPIRTIIVNRREFEIHVNSDGEFTAHVAGDYIKHDTLAATMAEIRRKAKKLDVKISIPVTVVGHGRWIGTHYNRKHAGDVHHGSIVEYDTDTHEYKIRFDDGGQETLDKWGAGDFAICKPMNAEDVKEWHRLRKEREAASERFRKFTERFEFKDVHGVVKAAYEKAIDQPEEEGLEDVALEGDPRITGTDHRSRKRSRSSVLVPPGR